MKNFRWQLAFVLIVVLCGCVPAWGQELFPTGAPYISHQLVAFPVYSLNAEPVAGATLQTVGVTGQTTYYYWAVANYQIGAVLSPLGAVTNSNAALSGSNYNAIYLFAYPPGMSTGVDILRTTSNLAPTGACNCAVATAQTSGVINDQSNSLSSYTVSVLVPQALALWLENDITASNTAHLRLHQGWPPPGTIVADLSTSGSGVTGSGTTGLIPEWTGTSALGNSPIADDGTFIKMSTRALQVQGPGGYNAFANNIATTTCGGSNTIGGGLGFQPGCVALQGVLGQPASTTTTGNVVGVWARTSGGINNAFSVNVTTGLVAQNSGATTVTSSQWGAVIEEQSLANSAAAVPLSGGLYVLGENGGGGAGSNATLTLNNGLDAQTSVLTSTTGTDTNTTDITVHVESPVIQTAGTMTHHYGIYLEDQTVNAGGTNPDAWGIFEAGAAKNQFGGIVNGIGGFQQNGTALGLGCGTTTSCAGTATPLAHFVFGTVALTSASPSAAVVTGISPAFTSTATYNCTVTNQTTQANPLKVSNTSASSITITGPNTVTDSASYICIGT